eukprot:jgi/Mesvir1/27489/Mv07261-RA.1
MASGRKRKSGGGPAWEVYNEEVEAREGDAPTDSHPDTGEKEVEAHHGERPPTSVSASIVKEGDVVWAKYQRFAWWPAMVVSADNLPGLLAKKPRGKDVALVKFFGTFDLAWIFVPEHVQPFLEVKDPLHKRRSKLLKEAIVQAEEFVEHDVLPDGWFVDAVLKDNQGQGEGAGGDDADHDNTEREAEVAAPPPQYGRGADRGMAYASPKGRPGSQATAAATKGGATSDGAEGTPGGGKGGRVVAKKVSADAKRQRQERVMRHLGLMPPVGSPFAGQPIMAD